MNNKTLIGLVAAAGKKDEYLTYGTQGVFGYSGPTPASELISWIG